MAARENQLNMRLSAVELRLLTELAEYYGLSWTAVLRMLVKERHREVVGAARERTVEEE